MTQIAASIMCADQLHIVDELARLEEAQIELLHCDVMDGIYVNNLALFPEWIQAIKGATNIPLDIHLATVTPEKYIDMFAPISPEYISFHIEVTDDVYGIINQIRSYGVKPAIALNPETPVEKIIPYLGHIDMILALSVNPGFAGQKFQKPVLQKMKDIKEILKNKEHKPLLECDGNINSQTINMMEGMPDVYVLGTSALFHKKDESTYKERVEDLRGLFSSLL